MEITIRKAQQKDVLDVYKIANDKQARENSINQEHISLENHKIWFSKKIDTKECLFFIITEKENKKFIGYARIDRQEGGWFISINIDKEYRKKGLGVKIIKEVSKKTKQNIKAVIKKENIASIKAFEKAGYSYKNNIIIRGEPFLVFEFINIT